MTDGTAAIARGYLIVRRLKEEKRAKTGPTLPLALKLAYGIATPVIGSVYHRRYGAGNFLWLSDLAYALTAAAVITESRSLASIAAGILPLELAWNLDFLCRGKLFGLADYMFDQKLPRFLRALSLFHVALPPTLLGMLRRFGYDKHAFRGQIALTAGAIVASRAFTKPESNINWAFGFGQKGRAIYQPLSISPLRWPS